MSSAPTAPRILPKDAHNKDVQTGGAFITNDGTATTKTSPLTVGSSAVTITVPTNAAEFIIVNTNNDLQVSEESAMAQYFVVPGSTGQPISCMNMNFIYLKRNGASDCTVQFYFKTL